MPIDYPATIPDLLTRFGLNPLDFTAYTDLLRELQELFDVAGTNPQAAAGTIGNRMSAIETELASPALLVITADSATISTTAVESAFSNGAYTVPADSAVIGRTFRITAGGNISTAASSPGTLALRIRWGNAITDPLLVGCGPQGSGELPTSMTNRGWYFHATVTVRAIGASGSGIGNGTAILPAVFSGTSTVAEDTQVGAVTINTTAAKALTLFAKWSVSSASNQITLETFVVEQVN